MEDFEPTTMLKLFIKYVNSLIVVTLEVSAMTGTGTTQRMVFLKIGCSTCARGYQETRVANRRCILTVLIHSCKIINQASTYGAISDPCSNEQEINFTMGMTLASFLHICTASDECVRPWECMRLQHDFLLYFSCVQQEGNHALIQHAAMCFYEEVCALSCLHEDILEDIWCGKLL